MASQKVHIKVFVTSSLKFRAVIKEPDEPTYEVSVNGESWNQGKGREYEAIIKNKMKHIIGILSSEVL
jgi:hypothetical protein